MSSRAVRALLAVIAAFTLALASEAAGAANDQAPAAKPKRDSHRVQPRNRIVHPNVDSVGATCAYDRAAGRCMIDLGNGRCMECSAGPFK